ncbi:TetR/AcrR family transcriptional regulator [Arthrobacter sp. B2a2-09]|uniref:TetR/AcrR family transcriptional regulator n=1 Tax=Arthrobacter sp. B2a2-09 TaxID=2952822 RepID=UPI0022CDB27B|nr:TetR/AcrR family transcriptional regulator [Arthrobacter sp. B2a2-09]
MQVPKIVDHQERRARVAEVVWRMVGEQGLDAVTMLSVARGSGLSAGTIQHYFANKSELVRLAMSQTFDRTDTRLEGIANTSPAIDAVREMAYAILPMDDERRNDVSAWLGFVGRLGADPALLEMYQAYYARARERWCAVLREGVTDGSIRPDIDIAAEADVLVGLTDGLAMQAVMEGLPVERVEQAFEAYLSTLREKPPLDEQRPASNFTR